MYHVYIAELVFWEEETRTKVLVGGGFGGVHMCLCVSLHVCEQE